MDALIVFGDSNAHPLRFILNKKHRHVWCAIRSDDFWIVYNWHHGIPRINVVDGQVDLASHYRDKNCEVIETTVGNEPCHGPWMCNNCVGHTMVICGIRTHHIYTPHQLWKHLTGKTMFNSIRNFFRRCEFMPGFGGIVSTPPPEPTRTTAVARGAAGKVAARKPASSTPLGEEPGDDRGEEERDRPKKRGTLLSGEPDDETLLVPKKRGALFSGEPGNTNTGGVLKPTTFVDQRKRRRKTAFDFRV